MKFYNFYRNTRWASGADAMKTISQVVGEFEERTGARVEVLSFDFAEYPTRFSSLLTVYPGEKGKEVVRVAIPSSLSAEYGAIVLEKELRSLEAPEAPATVEEVLQQIIRLVESPAAPKLAVCTYVIPEREATEGLVVKSAAVAWQSMIEEILRGGWQSVYEIDPRLWEEIIAGALERTKLYDEVILTPRSNDNGCDIIATKNGFSGFRVICSVKRYAPGNLITRAQVDELLGTLSRKPNASKGILTTTSDFAPGVRTDSSFTALMPTRLELINGTELQALFRELLRKNPIKR